MLVHWFQCEIKVDAKYVSDEKSPLIEVGSKNKETKQDLCVCSLIAKLQVVATIYFKVCTHYILPDDHFQGMQTVLWGAFCVVLWYLME